MGRFPWIGTVHGQLPLFHSAQRHFLSFSVQTKLLLRGGEAHKEYIYGCVGNTVAVSQGKGMDRLVGMGGVGGDNAVFY